MTENEAKEMSLREVLAEYSKYISIGTIEEFKALKDAEKQGLLLRNPKDLENAILDRMKEFMDEYRSYSESSVDHFGGKADSMETAMKIVKGAFKQTLAEMKGGAE